LVAVADNDDDCDSGLGNNFASRVIGVPVVSGTTYYIEWDDRWATSLNPFDWTLTFLPIPDCGDPAGVTATSTETSSNFNWTAPIAGTPVDYNWEIQPDGVAQGTAGALASGSVAAITVNSGVVLTASTPYEFYVQTNCGIDGTSNYVTIGFTTLGPGDTCALSIATNVEMDCGVATPVTLDFDAGGVEFLPSCDTFGNNGYWISTTTTATGALSINIGGTAAGLGVAVFDACGGTEIFCNNNTLGATFDLIGFVPNTAYYFYFWQDVVGGIAEICFEEISCFFPTALNATVTTTTDAEISWTANNSPAETAWEYVVQVAGTGLPVGAGTATTANPTTVTGVSGTNYEFYVRANCGAGSFSAWNGPFTWTQLLPPANDTAATATPIIISPEGTGCATFTFANSVGGDGTTDSGLNGSCNGASTGLDRFYTWTATTSALIWNDGDGGPGIVIREATAPYTEITCEATLASADFQLSGWTIGDDLIIQIYDFDTADVDTSFCLELFTPLPPPANDDCANATDVAVFPYNEVIDATGATNNAGFITCAGMGSLMNDGVWYTFTTIAGGTVDIAITGVTGWDPEVRLFSGSCGTFTCVANADSGGVGASENITGATVAATTQYWINVASFSGFTDGPEGPFTIDISTPDGTTLQVSEYDVFENFKYFPNPVSSTLNLRAQNNIENVSIYNKVRK